MIRLLLHPNSSQCEHKEKRQKNSACVFIFPLFKQTAQRQMSTKIHSKSNCFVHKPSAISTSACPGEFTAEFPDKRKYAALILLTD